MKKTHDWLTEEQEKYQEVKLDDRTSISKTYATKIKSSKNIEIYSLEDMLKKDEKFAKKIFLQRRVALDNAPEATYLNRNFHECNFMFVRKGKKAELDIIYDNSISMNFIFLEEYGSLRLSGNITSDSMNCFEIRLEENSKLDNAILKNKGCFAYHNLHTICSANSTVNSVCFWSGNGLSHATSELNGIEAKTMQTCLATCGDKEKLVLNSNAIHSANNTKSNLIMRGVAQGSSNILFNGSVIVESNGRKSLSKLSQEIMLLDSKAKAETNPVLEIKNNDVECSHSAAIRKIGEEKIFYLQTRGLSMELAKTTLVMGFLRNAINKVENRELRNMFMPSFMRD
ncbi:MAG: SufD family Fe-S cluster assembly protein [Candidatus Micrarchaeota archaeon]